MEERYASARYCFNIENCPVNESIKREIGECHNNYERNRLLKNRLSAFLKGRIDNQAINFRIINTWGGIRQFRDCPENQARIFRFFNRLERTPHRCGVDAIASFSKVVSFIKPKHYFVYDSRVAYSLNWLLRQAGAREGFFPIPPGQSSLAKNCNLKGVLDYEGRTFQHTDLAYYNYCKLVQRLYKDICPNGNEPYEVEMLLFQLAPCEIKDAFINEFQGTPFFCSPDRTTKQDITFQDCSVKGRRADYGILLCFHGHPLYIFVGRNTQNNYCELLFKGSSDIAYPIQDELINEGFVIKGGRNPYLIKLFSIEQESSARECYENVLNRVREH